MRGEIQAEPPFFRLGFPCRFGGGVAVNMEKAMRHCLIVSEMGCGKALQFTVSSNISPTGSQKRFIRCKLLNFNVRAPLVRLQKPKSPNGGRVRLYLQKPLPERRKLNVLNCLCADALGGDILRNHKNKGATPISTFLCGAWRRAGNGAVYFAGYGKPRLLTNARSLPFNCQNPFALYFSDFRAAPVPHRAK